MPPLGLGQAILDAFPDGWAKVKGQWFRFSEYECPEPHGREDLYCCLPPVSLFELHDDDWSK